MKMLTPAVRTYIYGVVSAALPLLVGAGFLAPEDVQQWLLLAAAILGLGANVMAAANVTPKKPTETVETKEVQPGLVAPLFRPEGS